MVARRATRRSAAGARSGRTCVLVTRFAFVGCGRVVEAFHLPALAKIDDVHLTALVAAGGVLVDFGSHVFDALSWWLGPLTVLAYEDDACGGVEAECRAQLSDARGVLIDVELTRLRHIPCTARIDWDRATIEIDLRSG